MIDRVFDLDGRRVAVSSPEKVLFPQDGVTKADLADHYAAVADTALPHYRDRPVTLHRFPDGIGADGFFRKTRRTISPTGSRPRGSPSRAARSTTSSSTGRRPSFTSPTKAASRRIWR